MVWLPVFGFLAGSTCCLSAEAVACVLRPDLHEEVLTCLAGRVLRYASRQRLTFRTMRALTESKHA
jgi:hypothetical protein